MTRLRSALETIVFARPVPFDGADGGVDHDGPAANVGAVFDAGGRAFLAGGNTGEYYSLADLG